MKSIQCVQQTPVPPSGMHTAGGEQTGHYPDSHCISLGPTGQGDSLETEQDIIEEQQQHIVDPASGMYNAGGSRQETTPAVAVFHSD